MNRSVAPADLTEALETLNDQMKSAQAKLVAENRQLRLMCSIAAEALKRLAPHVGDCRIFACEPCSRARNAVRLIEEWKGRNGGTLTVERVGARQ